MKYIVTLLFIAVFLTSCQNDKKRNLLSTPDQMQAQEIDVPVDKDTTIATENGAILQIPKGALTANGSRVTLEIKEAYSIEAMIRAGLTTQSNGEPLSSGGMIYINAKGGQDVKITKAIRVALPASYLDNKMQLFKGEKDADGNINWTDPKPLPSNKQLNSIDQGKPLFETRCATCHTLGRDATGPDLAQFMKRFPITGEGSEKKGEMIEERYQGPDERYYEHGIVMRGESVHGFLRIDATDKPWQHIYKDEMHPDAYFSYKCNLVKQYGSSGPILFMDRKSRDSSELMNLLSIYKYIQNESDRRNLPLPAQAQLKASADSCELYEKTLANLHWKKDSAELRRKGLIRDNGKLTEEKHNPGPPPPPGAITVTQEIDYDKVVSPENNGAVYYQFTIESFGWYNIDVLMKGVDGNGKSELRVRIIGQYREKLDIFLVIPSMNAFVKGGPTGKQDEYAFGYKDGTLYIPQNATAYIIGYKETSSSIAFALKKFTTTTQQDFEMELQESTVEAFNAAVAGVADNVRIGVQQSKNASEIRKTDTILNNIDAEFKRAERLRPKGCDCNCGLSPADSVKAKPASRSELPDQQ